MNTFEKKCLIIIVVIYAMDCLIITPLILTFVPNTTEVGFLASRGYELIGIPYFYLSFPFVCFVFKKYVEISYKYSVKYGGKYFKLPLICGVSFFVVAMLHTIIHNVGLAL